MKEKIKKSYKRTVIPAALIVLIALLVLSPNLYWLTQSSLWYGQRAICGNVTNKNNAQRINLSDIYFQADTLNFRAVSMTGELRYSKSGEAWYLKDGIYILPLDTADCQNMNGFKNDQHIVAIQGTVQTRNGTPFLLVSDLQETVPTSVQIFYSGGIWGLIALVVFFLSNLPKFLRFFFIRLQGKNEHRTSLPENHPEKQAKKSLIFGIVAFPAWMVNPILGAGLQIYSLIAHHDGIRSRRRIKAFSGMILCSLGLIIMPIESIGFERFEKPIANFYASSFGPLKKEVPVKPRLEILPRVNDGFHVSVHPPLGWTSVDMTGKTDTAFIFRGSEYGRLHNEPFYPEMNVSTVPCESCSEKNDWEIFENYKKNLFFDKNIDVTSEKTRKLSQGAYHTLELQTSETRENSTFHGLVFLLAENHLLYIVKTEVPEEMWNREYETLIQNSIETLKIWKASFASCLRSKGVTMYGTLYCEPCQIQKNLFTDGDEDLRFIECNAIEGTKQLRLCSDKSITGYPTWEFSDGSMLVGAQTLDVLAEKTGCALGG
ncbi:MAG: hypothetical protein HY453_01185 [Parcubacteria group bacterium]|nr:hypothetical protein [Parcubacteria group bacterium]